MPYSTSLTDPEWELIKPLLPKKKRTRPPRWTKRQIELATKAQTVGKCGK